MEGKSETTTPINEYTYSLKKLMNGSFDVDAALDLIKNGAAPDTENDNRNTVDELIVEFYLKGADITDLEPITKTKKMYEAWPVKVFLGQVNNQNVVIKELEYGVDTYGFRTIKFLKEYCEEVYFMKELQGSPNIVKFMGHNVNGFCHSIIMEHAVHGSLQRFISKYPNSNDNWGFRYEILRGITDGVGHMHKQKILHCDLKSANVLIDKNMKAKIADFGSAQHTNKTPKRALTTFVYRAPELHEDFEYSEKSDIFSLALIFWEVAAWAYLWDHLRKSIHNEEDMFFYYNEGNRMDIPDNCPPKLSAMTKWGWSLFAKNRPSALELQEELKSDMGVISDNLAKFV